MLLALHQPPILQHMKQKMPNTRGRPLFFAIKRRFFFSQNRDFKPLQMLTFSPTNAFFEKNVNEINERSHTKSIR
jgi:hypothetical protein